MPRKKYHLHLASVIGVVLTLGLAIAPRLPISGSAMAQETASKVPPESGIAQTSGRPLRNGSKATQLPVEINFQVPPGHKGTPEQSGGAGTRGQCPPQETFQTNSLLTLLLPGNEGLTIAEHPTFFVYVPPTSSQEAKLVVQDEGGNKNVYETTFPLSGTPGIIRLELPDEAPPLEIGKNYKWFFVIICPSQNISTSENPTIDLAADPFAFGWVQRIGMDKKLKEDLEKAETPLEKAVVYAKNGIWYDTLSILAQLRLAEPENSNLTTTWEWLLTSEAVKLDAIAQAPLLDCCSLSKQEVAPELQSRDNASKIIP